MQRCIDHYSKAASHTAWIYPVTIVLASVKTATVVLGALFAENL